MAKVKMSTELQVPADQVWSLLGRFNAVPEWHPAVASSKTEGEGVGSVRTLELAGGGAIEERLEHADDHERVYSYSILSGPLPVMDYTATIRVRDEGDGTATVVEWSSEFKPKGASESDATQVIQDIYQAGLDNLKKLMGG